MSVVNIISDNDTDTYLIYEYARSVADAECSRCTRTTKLKLFLSCGFGDGNQQTMAQFISDLKIWIFETNCWHGSTSIKLTFFSSWKDQSSIIKSGNYCTISF